MLIAVLVTTSLYANKWLDCKYNNCITLQYLKPVKCVQKKNEEKCSQAHLKMLSKKCVYKSSIWIYMYKQDMAFNNL